MSKTIFLKSLSLKNFKKVKESVISFANKTNIFGDNGVGKTTIFDSFTWLLFGKDSHEITKFDVQPLDKNGKIIDHLETEVSGTLLIDGVETVLRKVLKQKWVKPKGQPEAELKGTSTDYYINEVPQKEKEFQQKIDEIIPEKVFKLLTNPLYFSSIMDWKERRNIIFEINGDVSQEDVINYNENLSALNSLLKPNESMEDFQKRVKAQISKLKSDREGINPRIDELNKQIKEDIDFNAVEVKKRGLLSDIKVIEDKLLDTSKASNEVSKKRDKLYNLKDKLKDMEWDLKQSASKPLDELKKQFQEVQINLNSARNKYQIIQNDIQNTTENIKHKEEQKTDLLNKWHEGNDKTFEFDESKCICPTCKRPFETEDIDKKREELLGNFNEDKARDKARINKQGKDLATEIEGLQSEISSNKTEVDTLTSRINKLEEAKKDLDIKISSFEPTVNFEENQEYQSLKAEIEALEKELETPGNDSIVRELRGQKTDLNTELEDVNSQLSYKERNKELKERIEELKANFKDLGQRIAALEKAQYLSEEFTRTKVELLEGSINSKFQFVKIKLFNNQVNGGLSECCEVMVDGVPFSTNLNSGMRINAGLDIINTLSEHYQIKAPIFVDNKETVTRLIETGSQVISLIVSEADKQLRIVREE